MRGKLVLAFALSLLTTWSIGCRKEDIDKAKFKSAIDHQLGAQQECLWPAPVKFPAQADTSKEEQTKGYDALTDAGMLTRTPEEKKRFLIGSKRVNDYDLSTPGRTAWKPDQTQPGFGNFCFGSFKVTTIDSFTPNDATNPTEYQVNYHYTVEGVPAWAQTTEMKTAFEKIATDISGQRAASVTVVKSNGSLQVQNPPPGQ